MLIRIFSDLHYEFQEPSELWVPDILETDKDTILILAGDLWNGIKSIEQIRKFHHRFKKVLVVLGNHDYYKENIHEFGTEYQTELILQGLDNVELLDRNNMEIDGVLFVGATLWTNMRNEDPITVHMSKQYMVPDFSLIHAGTYLDDYYITRKNNFTPNIWLETNRRHFDYIKTITELNRDKQIVVITHHGCSWGSIHEYFKDQPVGNGYFVSEYSEFILDNPHISHYFHGHIHSCMDYMIGTTRVITNPRGYPREHDEFDEISLYEI